MKKNGFIPIVIILVIAILGVVGYLGYNNFLKPQDGNSDEENFRYIYKITLTVVDKNKEPKNVYDLMPYLAERLSIDNDVEHYFGFYLFYDESKYQSQWNWHWLSNDWNEMEFYLLAKKPINLKLIQESDGFVNISIEKGLDDLIPYLKDRKYCQSNNDCSIRENMCPPPGSFNKYTLYSDGYDCAGNGEYNMEEDCFNLITYTNSSCLNNECIGDILKEECSKY